MLNIHICSVTDTIEAMRHRNVTIPHVNDISVTKLERSK